MSEQNQTKISNLLPQQPLNNDDIEVDFMEYLQTLWQYRKFIMIILGITFLLSVIISLTKHNHYTATSLVSVGTIGKDDAGQYVSMLKGMAGGFFNVGSASTSNRQVLGLVKTRALADYLIDKFDLMKEFGVRKRGSAQAIIIGMLQVRETREDLIEFSVEYTDPKKAALFVNEAVSHIDYMINFLNIKGVSKQRQFLEQRLKEVQDSLMQSENILKEFQEKYKIIDIGAQISSTVNTLGVINTELIETETELGIKSKARFLNDPELLELQTKISELKKQQEKIAKLRLNPDQTINKNEDYFIALEMAPGIGLDFLRLKRNLKVQESLFELIMEQYELAKIDETKNLPKITVIDKAIPPAFSSGPNRKIIVVTALIFVLFFSIFFCFIFEYVRHHTSINLELLKFWRYKKR